MKNSPKTPDTVPECKQVVPGICTETGNESGLALNYVFGWNVAQQRCARVSSDSYCVWGTVAGFFRDVNECSLICGDSSALHGRTGNFNEDGQASPCKTTQPTFKCRDELKKVTARYDYGVRRCRPVRICLSGGYDTIEECNRRCVGKAFTIQ
ncbi:uncharacterized protein LOC142765477 isoform X2 [Rhipicephalus microplus]|uniref:uncharacterized protein LOC142765477 isoform X2 n=1 Tax=Rhipicephalus microplus TaxID=6941 RepID=UPI003F6CFF09